MSHMLLYLDESGDLGFDWNKKSTSPYFVITVLVCEGTEVQDQFKRAVKRTLKHKVNTSRSTKKLIRELKGSKTNLSTKKYFLKLLPEEGWGLYSLVLNKTYVTPYLKDSFRKKKLYNYLSKILLTKIEFSSEIQRLDLIVDKCKNSKEIKEFNKYVEAHLMSELPLNTCLNIDHSLSHDTAGIQSVDLFCWGISRKYLEGEHDWYNLFKSKIRREDVLFKIK